MSTFLSFFTQSFSLQIIGLVGSVLVLWLASDRVVWAAKNLARHFRISEAIIGLTVLSVGSSVPEIFINISAGLTGADDVGIGNVIGSCLVQISLVIGVVALVGGRLKNTRPRTMRDGSVLIGAIVWFFLMGVDGEFSVIEGIVSILLYASYIAFLFLQKKKTETDTAEPKGRMLWWIVGLVGGIFFVWLSARVLLATGLAIGREVGIAESILGLLVGAGTSLPELAISIMALVRRSSGLSIGNLLGSNVTDPLLSAGIGAIFAQGYIVAPFLLYTVTPIWFVMTVLVVGWLWYFKRIGRFSGAILALSYLVIFWLVL